jgi:kynureninase
MLPLSPTPAQLSALRRRFPTLHERTYFATQCLGPVPEEAFADLDDYRRTLLLRNRALPQWLERMEELFGLVETLLGAPAGSVALAPSATAAQASLAATLQPAAGRDRIVMTALDFHSSRYVWAAQAQRGFSIVEVPATADATLPAARLIAELDERVAVVTLAHVSPRTGALADIDAITAAAHAVGARVVVDAYQAVGVVPIDVARSRVDALVGGTHKWLCGGGTGLAFAYVRPDWAATLAPAYPGWMAHADLLGFERTFRPHDGARRLQQGVPALEPIYTARAGLRFVAEVGVEAIRARNLALSARLLEGIAALGLRTLTPVQDARRGGMVVVDVDDGPAVVDALDRRGIDVDYRPGAGVRMSPHYCTSEEDCDQLLAALRDVLR